METRIVIDAIVQQTTLLIAQLATSAGIRAPLAHLADQVFLDLGRELEQQGLSRKVVADMFGVALRTYQKKVNRLRSSVTTQERTQWQSVLTYIRDNGGATRHQILAAFPRDGERLLGAVLADLVSSGLLFATGRGAHAAYRTTSEHDRRNLSEEQAFDAVLHLVWLEIAEQPGVSRRELKQTFARREPYVDRALEALLQDGRIAASQEGEGADERFTTQRVYLPAGSEVGWEAAVLDHFRAVCVALASKLQRMDQEPGERQLIGGTTLCFEVHAEHPHADEARGLLEETRERTLELWERVSQHNQEHPVAEAKRSKVIFYFGQNCIEADEEPRGTE